MSSRRHIGFGSTPAFHNLYPTIVRATDNSGRLAYANYDPSLGEPPTEAQKELLESYKCELPVLTFQGSEKLHGENMAVAYTCGELWVQGRNHIRTLLGDQNGMAQFVENTKEDWLYIIAELAAQHSINTDTHTIVIDMEWAGGNIQKGNAACSGTDKGAYIFDYFRVVNNNTSESHFKPTTGLNIPSGKSIYLMSSFSRHELVLDFNNPNACEEALSELALYVEDNSAIARYFDKPGNVGEGVYLWTTYNGNTYRLKAKGLKHGGKPKQGKPNKPSLTDEVKAKLTSLADKITPVWRINQAITETNATERKHFGEVMKWVMADIVKEEMPVLQEAGVEIKQVQGFIAYVVREYYFDSIKGF